MYSSKSFADRRGFSLVEVMVSQVIALIVISGSLSLVVPLLRNFGEQEGAVEAQIRLREVSHVILRDVQGIGGGDGRAGSLFTLVADGGAFGSDQMRIFKRAQGLCTGQIDPGSLAVRGSPGVNLTVQLDGTSADLHAVDDECPMRVLSNCSEALLADHEVLVSGPGGAAAMRISSVNASSCRIQLNPNANPNVVADYNRTHGTSIANINQLFDAIATPASLIIGSTFEYRVVAETLERSVDGGPFKSILPGVHDLQVVRAFDVDNDGLVSAGEWDETGTLVGATPFNFFGAKVGIVTFGGARAGVENRPPVKFGNRNLTAAPVDRRYRSSFIFAAARNR